MLKTIMASKIAKSAALCVCPVVGTAVVSTNVPQIRKAVHNATAPKRSMAAKPAGGAAREKEFCPEPVILTAGPVTLPRVAAALPAGVDLPERIEGPLTSTATSGSPGGFFGSGPGFGGGNGPVLVFPGQPGGGGGGIGGPGVPTPPGGGTLLPPAPPGGVPEVATWLQLTVGFGVAGAAIRGSRHKRGVHA